MTESHQYWTLAKKLEGKTLYTKAQAKPFKIIEVDNERLTFERGQTGKKPTTYNRKLIETCCELRIKNGEVSLDDKVYVDNCLKRLEEYNYLPVIVSTIEELSRAAKIGG